MKHNVLILVSGLVDLRFHNLIHTLLQTNLVIDIKSKHWNFWTSKFLCPRQFSK